MRYFYQKPDFYSQKYGSVYRCNHPVYDQCTLYLIGDKGLAVIQQRFDAKSKHTYWTEIDPWLTDAIYIHPKFMQIFEALSGSCTDGLYPTVTVRQIMYALRMKPLIKEQWETVFDHKYI